MIVTLTRCITIVELLLDGKFTGNETNFSVSKDRRSKAKEEDVAQGIADAAKIFNVGVFGMVNTFHEKVYKERGVKFFAEFYSDLEYDETGYLVIAKGRNKHYPTDRAVQRCLKAIAENKVTTISGKDVDVGCETICVHSDTPNAIEILSSPSNYNKYLR